MRLPAVRLTPRDRRAVVLGASLVALALALRAVPAAARWNSRVHARADAVALELARGRELVAANPELRDSLAARAGRLVALAPRLVPGTTAEQAQAELAGIVIGAATRAQVRVARQESRADSATGLFVRVAMRIEAEGDVAGVTRWLAALEEQDPTLTVNDLSMRASDPTAPPQQAERLRVEATVAGWASPHRGADARP